MRIQEESLRHWVDNFYGYGSWQSKLWFVAYEESGGDSPEEVAEKLDYFYSSHPEAGATLCDIRSLYKGVAFPYDGPKANVYSNLYEFRFDKNATLNTVWGNLILFSHGFRGLDIPDTLEYQRKKFASQSGAEALIKLYPLPSPHGHAWYYNWLDLPIEFLKSRKLYQDHVYGSRMETILGGMGKYEPEVVLMYGMQNINQLKNTVKEVFPDSKFRMVSAVKKHIPQYHRTQVGNTTLIVTTQIPALRHNRVETGFDWEAFGKSVRARA